MMVETALVEATPDFGGALPQWKRELLQRRAARSRPAPPAPPPPPPPPADDDEELRYGPGIVKRLKSRYLSLALRDAPRRRPSLLRRAASLEQLLDERPPPAPRAAPRAARPASVAAPPLAPAARRDSVKRARSVDALSRLDAHEELAPPQPRAARPPRRPAPLLRDAERPPLDVVRSTLRKFESAPPRRAAPAARVSAVLRGLEAPRRSLSPERGCSPAEEADGPAPASAPSPPSSPAPPPPRSPPPPPSPPAAASPEPSVASEPESAPRAGPLAESATPRRVGVIRPMPASPLPNGHSTPEPSRIERAWSGSGAPPWPRARARAPASAANSVVFNFSDRKEVPDYVENDGVVLRGRRPRPKAGSPGVVVLRTAPGGGGSSSESDGEGAPPSPCAVRFVNDNVLINGRSSLAAGRVAARVGQLKLHFDDSLTRTFEYPSETSLCEDAPPAALPDNTHMASAALSRYTPHKTAAPAFELGVAPAAEAAEARAAPPEERAAACAAAAPRAWSDARARTTDLLF